MTGHQVRAGGTDAHAPILGIEQEPDDPQGHDHPKDRQQHFPRFTHGFLLAMETPPHARRGRATKREREKRLMQASQV